MLFFALMMGAADLAQRGAVTDERRPQLIPPQRFRELRCRKLVVEDMDHQPLAILTQNDSGDIQLSLIGKEGPAASLSNGAAGGRLVLMRHADKQAILLGHDSAAEFSGALGVAFDKHDMARPAETAKSLEILPWP